MSRSTRYPPEMRERAVRMILDREKEYPSRWKAVCAIGEQLGIHRETLRIWMHPRPRPTPVTAPGSRPTSESA